MANWFRKSVFSLLAILLIAGCGDITAELFSITVTPNLPKVGINQYKYFSALGKDSSGNDTAISPLPTWSVNGNIGSINPTTGIFTAGSRDATGYVVAASGSISGQTLVTVTAKCWLQGRVTDTNLSRVQGMRVHLKDNTNLFSFSDSNGNYSISDIPAGTYEARIDATTFYEETSLEVNMISGETLTWNPILTVQPNAPTIPTTTFPAF
jgi:hypothetical protein